MFVFLFLETLNLCRKQSGLELWIFTLNACLHSCFSANVCIKAVKYIKQMYAILNKYVFSQSAECCGALHFCIHRSYLQAPRPSYYGNDQASILMPWQRPGSVWFPRQPLLGFASRAVVLARSSKVIGLKQNFGKHSL